MLIFIWCRRSANLLITRGLLTLFFIYFAYPRFFLALFRSVFFIFRRKEAENVKWNGKEWDKYLFERLYQTWNVKEIGFTWSTKAKEILSLSKQTKLQWIPFQCISKRVITLFFTWKSVNWLCFTDKAVLAMFDV